MISENLKKLNIDLRNRPGDLNKDIYYKIAIQFENYLTNSWTRFLISSKFIFSLIPFFSDFIMPYHFHFSLKESDKKEAPASPRPNPIGIQ